MARQAQLRAEVAQAVMRQPQQLREREQTGGLCLLIRPLLDRHSIRLTESGICIQLFLNRLRHQLMRRVPLRLSATKKGQKNGTTLQHRWACRRRDKSHHAFHHLGHYNQAENR